MDKPELEKPPPVWTQVQDAVLGGGVLMGIGVFYFFLTLIQKPFLAIRDFQQFRHEAFSNFWVKMGKQLSSEFSGMDLLPTASGVVLDLGPGTGECLRLFNPTKINKAYGPEPAVKMHPALQANIDKAGLHGKYEILAAGAEPDSLIPALAKKGVFGSQGLASSGVFDTILCTRVLCGVPNTEETVQTLYKLLKPGGRIIVSEHVTSPWPKKGTFVGFAFQKLLVLLGWNFWMGGCTLNKSTLQILERSGGKDGWKEIDLRFVRSWAPTPYIVGTLTKA